MPLTPEVWLDEFTVNTVTSGVQLDPDITQLANGNILVSWTSSTNTGAGSPAGLDILGQLYNSRGEPIGGEIILNQTIQDNNESAAKVTALPGGGFAMAYIANDGNGADIEVAVFNASGVEQSRRTVVAGDTALPDYRSPVIAAISDTQALIAYVEDNSSGEDRILVHAYNTSTDTLGIVIEAFDSADFNDGNITNLQIDVLDTGNYIVAGTIEGTGNSVFRVISPISAIVSGSRFGVNQTVDTSVAALTGGTFALVAQRALFNGDNFLEITVVGTSGGLSVVGSTLINPSGVQNYNEPDVVALGDGGFIVFWDDDGANTLEGQRFDSSGNTIGNQFQLSDTPDAIQIEATLLGDGRVTVSFVASPTGQLSNIRQVIIDTRDDANSTPVYTPVSQQIGTIGDDTFTMTADEAFGGEGNDTITGSANNDTIFGGNGIDRLDGGAGADILAGGNGNDIYIIDNIGDVVNETGSDASDQVFTLVDYDVPDGVELLTQGGTGDLRTNGTDARDIIIGNSGNNTINGAGDGGLGDVMQGGDGNDSYAVDNSNDAVVETATGGNDAIDSLVDFNLAQSPNVETLILRRGSQTAVQAFGDDTDNQLFGNEFVNNLFGAGGTDFLLGFEGSDNFIITPENGAVDVIGDFDFMGDKDRIGISGFGANAQVVQVSTESFEIRSADGSITQQFILQGYTGGGLVEGTDYFFG